MGDRMNIARAATLATAFGLCAALAACGGDKRPTTKRVDPDMRNESGTIWDIFGSRRNANDAVAVNRYLWNASLEVLNFLPVQSVDPFTGVIVTGYGTPPGGGRAYRATVQVTDPALDARSLKLSMQGPGGAAVAPDTVRAVEDAILTRARQLRVRDGRL